MPVLVVLLLCAVVGCTTNGLKAASIDSLIALHSGGATLGVPLPSSTACIMIIGRHGMARGMAMVYAHGTVTVEQCMRLFEPSGLPPVP